MSAFRPNRSVPPAAVIPVLQYPDVREAAAWLVRAFGFTERLRIGGGHRIQMTWEGGALVVAEGSDARSEPVNPDRGSGDPTRRSSNFKRRARRADNRYANFC